jgi:hypothetical protein
MRGLTLVCLALGAGLTTTLLVACGGSQPPIGAPGAMPQSRAIATRAERVGSWMLPEAKAASSSGSDLLYLAGLNHMWILSYPQGRVEASFDTEAEPRGMCSDSSGDVFVPTGGNEILEYAHGATQPTATLQEATDNYSWACSVDPLTGNLAVTNNTEESESEGNVAIFPGAQGAPTYYQDSSIWTYWFCGYDDQGNLFVDGDSAFAELPKGGTSFVNLSLSKDIDDSGQIQWDGKHITVASSCAESIWRLSISGSKATVLGNTELGGPHFDGQCGSWIEGQTVAAPRGGDHPKIEIWKYPRGGQSVTVRRFGKTAFLLAVTPSEGGSH